MRSHGGFLVAAVALVFCVLLSGCGGGHSGSSTPMHVVITNATLPPGIINAFYTTNLNASGGIFPYTYSISAGSLPVGLTLDASTGVISGIPTVEGVVNFTAQASDSKSNSGTANLSINIEGVVVVTTSSLPDGVVGQPYSQTLTATGGVPPYTWSLASGNLPPGLTLSPQGMISGTPTTLGSYTFTVQASDSENPPARGTSGQLTLHIQGNLAISTTSLPQGTVNIAYDTQVMATGGLPPYTWSYTGTLPPGLTLNKTSGIISGVPTTAGSYPIVVSVTDAEMPPITASANLSITIVPTPPLQITTTSLPSGVQGSPYVTALMATGGVPPYSWTLINGTTLPAGLVMSPSGIITGTPTASGTFPLTVQVVDTRSMDTPATANLSIALQAAAGPVIVTKALPSALQNVAYQAQLQVTGGTPPYTFAIVSGNLPAGLNLNSSTGAISGTPSAIGLSNVTVEATDSAMHTSAGVSLGISVTAPVSNASLKGSYAFSFNGYANASPVLMAGSFVANGDGTFANGEFDVNGSNGASTQTLLAGQSSYSLQPNGMGTMTFVTAQGTYNFSIAVSVSGNGRFIQDNSDPATRGSGVIKPQTIVTPPKGPYAFGSFGGDSAGGRFASAGAFILGNTGNVINGIEDTNDNGTLANPSFTGVFNAPDQNGRGTAIFTVAGTNYNYAYYSVSNTEVIFLGTDPIATVPISLGSILAQGVSGISGGSNGSLKGTGALELNGVDTSGSPVAAVSAGLLTADGTIDGNGNGNISASFDENDGGTVTYSVVQGQYSVASNGRTTITTTFAPNPPVLYVVGQNHAFVVGTDKTVTSGILEPTLAASYGVTMLGPYVGGTVTPVLSGITDEVDYFNGDGAILTGSGVTSAPGGQGSVNLSATYQVDATGRALLSGTPAGIVYVISPSKVVLLPSGATPSLSIFSAASQ
jgi:hypothetical protein